MLCDEVLIEDKEGRGNRGGPALTVLGRREGYGARKPGEDEGIKRVTAARTTRVTVSERGDGESVRRGRSSSVL